MASDSPPIGFFDRLSVMNRVLQSDAILSSAELAECNCPDDCQVDHENA
jgi:hypothetical protein